MREISFVVDGQMLRGTIFYPEKIKKKNPAIFFIHGWLSSEDSTKGRAQALAELGFISMTFSMRGHGKSEGDSNTLTRRDFLNDAIAAYDFLTKQQGVDSSAISVIGASFGGYLATLVTRERAVKHLVLRVPANYSGELNTNHRVFSGDNGSEYVSPKFRSVIGKKTYSIEALHRFSGNVLIVESEKDDTIPHGVIQDYIDAVKDASKVTHVVIKNANHGLTTEDFKKQYTEILVDWFKDKL